MPDRTNCRLDTLYANARDAFRAAGLETPDLDARLLVTKALGLDAASVFTHPDHAVGAAERDRVETFIQRRLQREPVGRILGEREFWSLGLRLSEATLEPRADTETVVEAVLGVLAARPHGTAPLTVLDIGTGTGAILLALLSEIPDARGICTDIDPRALETARYNAGRHRLLDRIGFVCCDYFAPLRMRADIIVSNPPYIPSNDIARLAEEVGRHDPRRALDGGADGLDAYRTILAASADALAPGGFVVLEFGDGQGKAVTAIARQNGFTDLTIRHDLAGLERALVALLP